MTALQTKPADQIAQPEAHETHREYSMKRVRWGLSVTLVGEFVFLLGARPSLFGLDRSPVIGFVQISVFLVGLAMICMGGYICLAGLWNHTPRSILADIGLRLVTTGFVIAVFAGMADIMGLGTQKYPDSLPTFGPWQALGVMAGEAIIAIGFLMVIPFHFVRRRKQ